MLRFKIEIGYFLFFIGLILIIVVASENGSGWWVALGGVILSIGLDLLMDGKIDSAIKGLNQKSNGVNKDQEPALSEQEKLEKKLRENFPNLFYLLNLKEDLEWFETRWGAGNGLGGAYDPYGRLHSIYELGGEQLFKQHLEEEKRIHPSWLWTAYAENVQEHFKSNPEISKQIDDEIKISREFKNKVKQSKLTELEKEFLLYFYWQNRVAWEDEVNNLSRVYNYQEATDKGFLRNFEKGINLYELNNGDVSRFVRKV
jgi:hypothetical protein